MDGRLHNIRIRMEQSLYTGHCSEGDRCVCGGDTPRVRAGCGNWVLDPLATEQPASDGATLRDQFAMAALTGLLASPFDSGVPKSRFAASAYEYADAMLAARQAQAVES